VNYERGTELFGDDFEKAYSYNLEKLREVIGNEKIELLDLSHICTKNEFANVTTPDETTNYNGRVKVADKICQEIGRISNNG
jgi:hypothetical protein